MMVFAIFAIFTGQVSCAEQTTGEKLKTVKNKSVDKVRESYRDMKDKLCETVNGKVECVDDKVENNIKTFTEKAETKAIEMKDRID